MDFTFLFLTVLMLFAWQSNMPMVALALFLVAMVSAFKSANKILLAGGLVAACLGVVLYLGIGELSGMIVVGGLLLILIITMMADNAPPQYGAGGGGMYG